MLVLSPSMNRFTLFIVVVLTSGSCAPDPSSDRGHMADAMVAPLDGMGGSLGSGNASDASLPVPMFAMANTKQLAVRLGKLLWNDPAASGIEERIGTSPSADTVRSAAAAMLVDPRGRAGVAAFFRWVLLLDELKTWPKPKGAIDDLVRSSMMNEAPLFAAHVVFDDDATFDRLFTAPYTMMNEALAAHYGLEGQVKGEQFVPIPYPNADERVGVLGGAGVLTLFAGPTEPTWPSRRYGLVSRVAFCTLPFPYSPMESPFPLGSVDVAALLPSARKGMESYTASKGCQSCHGVINAVGFAFGRFDTIGKYVPNDASGRINVDADIPNDWGQPPVVGESLHVNGQRELSFKIAHLPEARRCLTLRWLQYIQGADPRLPQRPFDDDVDPLLIYSLEQAHRKFEASDANIRSLILALVETPTFLAETSMPALP